MKNHLDTKIEVTNDQINSLDGRYLKTAENTPQLLHEHNLHNNGKIRTKVPS